MTEIIDYSEEYLIEQPAINLFKILEWRTTNCFHEFDGTRSFLGRETPTEVVLLDFLRPALKKLNPVLPSEAITSAIEELTRDRSKMSLAMANREIFNLIKDGVKVTFRKDNGKTVTETVKIIDWNNPVNNDFFLASQFWVSGEMYKRRLDLVGFVNGLPFVAIELKAAHKNLKNAYDKNLRDYKSTIPQLFWYNTIVILSNGSKSRIGSVTAGWEHFNEWKKINSEGEEGVISLDTMIRGTCDQAKLIDLVENFIIFSEEGGGLIKLLAKNHQYLGVNRAFNLLKEIKKTKGRLGVFWHTQGSGKSVSMIYFAQKLLRKLSGNWTFVIVTDRQELDEQIYGKFVNSGVLTEERAQAKTGRDLQQLLREDHRYVFTLIQKFRTEKGETYPALSNRSDIIVITDEAHRTQYDTYAMNMRSALPNASFIGFTGTPLMAGEEKTKEVFGDYVSIYNFRQSIEDGATVPLYYENRIPELQLTDEDFDQKMEELLQEAELDEKQMEKLEREFSRQYHLITVDDRLERIAKDIVFHFVNRGYRGKAMMVSIDKATAVKMYNKVQKYWTDYLKDLQNNLSDADEIEKVKLQENIEYMKSTDMAVVVSQSQNEVEDLRKKGVNIVSHRKRIVTEDLDDKFKDPKDPLRMVFVCAMWMTGFDVPCCSTIYLDKPMRNHTLMQTIARANRVFPDKINGLIVDYLGVFRSLQRALAIYAAGVGKEDTPVKKKEELIELLKEAVTQARTFCEERGIDPDKIIKAEGFERVKLLDEAVEAILVNDESQRRYLLHSRNVRRILKSIKPDPAVNDFVPIATLLEIIAHKIRSLDPEIDISEVTTEVQKLLNQSINAEEYLAETPQTYDLSRIDFETLRAKFKQRQRRAETERLRRILESTIEKMVKLNRTRKSFLERLQRMIDEYNAGSLNVEDFFKQLVALAQELKEEEKRGIAENLTEEELAVFDLLTKPEMKLTKKLEQQVKKISKDLLETLKKEKLVLDWRKRQQSRAAVRLCIEQTLEYLPQIYSAEIYQKKCDLTYQHVYDSYFGEGKSIYEEPTFDTDIRLAS